MRIRDLAFKTCIYHELQGFGPDTVLVKQAPGFRHLPEVDSEQLKGKCDCCFPLRLILFSKTIVFNISLLEPRCCLRYVTAGKFCDPAKLLGEMWL